MGTFKKSKVKFVKAQDGWEGKGAHGEPPTESKPQQTTRERFNAAFAAARKDPNNSGKFSFEGKSYTTQTKEEAAKKAPTAKTSPVAPPTKKAEPAKASPTPAKSTPAPEKKDTAYVSPKKVDASTFKTPEKKTEVAPVKKTTSSSDSVRAKMKADNDTLMAKQNRYYGKKYGSFKSGGKAKKC